MCAQRYNSEYDYGSITWYEKFTAQYVKCVSSRIVASNCRILTLDPQPEAQGLLPGTVCGEALEHARVLHGDLLDDQRAVHLQRVPAGRSTSLAEATFLISSATIHNKYQNPESGVNISTNEG